MLRSELSKNHNLALSKFTSCTLKNFFCTLKSQLGLKATGVNVAAGIRTRVKLGWMAAILAGLFAAWLPLGIYDIVPFVFHIPGETMLRSHAGLAVGALMIAAWGFWET